MATTNQNTYGWYGSEQQFIASLSIVDTPAKTSILKKGAASLVFDKFSGGDISAPVNKHRPGGMGPEITYLSLPTYSDITLTKAYNTQQDQDILADLHVMIGNTQVTVSIQPLDDAGNAWGTPRQYQGRLIGVKDGGTDSMSNAVRMWDVTIAVESIADATTKGTGSAADAINNSLNFGQASLGTY
jgi:hypothetical protein